MKKIIITIFCVITALATAQEVEKLEAAELAKKLDNPIASLISVPFQNNTDVGIGELNGSRNTINIQPVVPISITDNLNLITRWVQPVIAQYNIAGEGNHEFGLGDAVISAFLSPSNSKGGLTWGTGNVFFVPTGTNSFLTAEKFGIGPTAIALYQSNGITIGALVNQIWSIAGDDNRNDVNQLFFQPFFYLQLEIWSGIGC